MPPKKKAPPASSARSNAGTRKQTPAPRKSIAKKPAQKKTAKAAPAKKTKNTKDVKTSGVAAKAAKKVTPKKAAAPKKRNTKSASPKTAPKNAKSKAPKTASAKTGSQKSSPAAASKSPAPLKRNTTLADKVKGGRSKLRPVSRTKTAAAGQSRQGIAKKASPAKQPKAAQPKAAQPKAAQPKAAQPKAVAGKAPAAPAPSPATAPGRRGNSAAAANASKSRNATAPKPAAQQNAAATAQAAPARKAGTEAEQPRPAQPARMSMSTKEAVVAEALAVRGGVAKPAAGGSQGRAGGSRAAESGASGARHASPRKAPLKTARKRKTLKNGRVWAQTDRRAPRSKFSLVDGDRRQKRVPWSQEEVAALVKGWEQYGPAWSLILATSRAFDPCRTQVDLKDKFRSVKKGSAMPEAPAAPPAAPKPNMPPQIHYRAPVASQAEVNRKPKTRWTPREEELLLEGIKEFGEGKWTTILTSSNGFHEQRTSVDLKDKWRNLIKMAEKQGTL